LKPFAPTAPKRCFAQLSLFGADSATGLFARDADQGGWVEKYWCVYGALSSGTLGGVVVRRRRLRKLVPDQELVRRRASGETFRELALDYGVAHSTLVRYFDRPEVASQVKEAVRQLRAEQRAAADRRAADRRLEQQVRREARQQASREAANARQLPTPSGPRATVLRPSAPDPYTAWLDEHDNRTPLTRADLHSQNDRNAAAAVAAGGGLQAVISATGLLTVENVARLIDPAILKQAHDNDTLRNRQSAGP